MNDLIKIADRQFGEGSVPTVNARELHQFLEVKRDFSSWIKDRIDQYGLIEDQDFVVFATSGERLDDDRSPIPGSNRRGGQNRIEYHLTLDTAKELAMVERNAKGKQARLYFIECEKRSRGLLHRFDYAPAVAGPVKDDADFEACLRLAARFGYEGNQALLCANTGFQSYGGRDLLAAFQVALPSPENLHQFTPTQIGQMMGGIDGKSVNIILETAGLQTKVGKVWTMTEAGKAYGVLLDTGKKHKGGTPVQQLKWKESVVPLLRPPPAPDRN